MPLGVRTARGGLWHDSTVRKFAGAITLEGYG
jgi:hypothetical protein